MENNLLESTTLEMHSRVKHDLSGLYAPNKKKQFMLHIIEQVFVKVKSHAVTLLELTDRIHGFYDI